MHISFHNLLKRTVLEDEKRLVVEKEGRSRKATEDLSPLEGEVAERRTSLGELGLEVAAEAADSWAVVGPCNKEGQHWE